MTEDIEARRERIATAAMQSLLLNPDLKNKPLSIVAQKAVSSANALLSALRTDKIERENGQNSTSSG